MPRAPDINPVEHFTGFLNVQGTRVAVDFDVPIGATDAAKDAAFLAALAQEVDLSYLSLGERPVEVPALCA